MFPHNLCLTSGSQNNTDAQSWSKVQCFEDDCEIKFAFFYVELDKLPTFFQASLLSDTFDEKTERRTRTRLNNKTGVCVNVALEIVSIPCAFVSLREIFTCSAMLLPLLPAHIIIMANGKWYSGK